MLSDLATYRFNLPIRADGAGGLASGSVAAGIVFEQLTIDEINVETRGRESISSCKLNGKQTVKYI